MVDYRESIRNFQVIRKGAERADKNNYDIIFVHGLESRVTDSIRRTAKSWLRSLDSPLGIDGATIHTFGFKMTDLLVKGRERLLELSRLLRADVSKLKSQKLLFLGHGIAGWVIQATLGSYLGLEISQRTRGVVFIGLPPVKDDGKKWKELTMRFAEPFTKDASRLAGLEFRLLQSIEKDFLRTTDYDRLIVGYVDLPDHYSALPVLPKRRSITRTIRREGTKLSTRSSNNREIDTEKLFLPYIVKGDKIDIGARILLESIVTGSNRIEPGPIVRQLSNDRFRNEPVNLLTPPVSPAVSVIFPRQSRDFTEEPQWSSSKDQPYMEPESYIRDSPESFMDLKHAPQIPEQVALSKVAAQDLGTKRSERSFSKDTSIRGDKRLDEVMELSDLARSYYQNGHLRQARRIYEDVIKEVKPIEGWKIDTLIILAEFEIAVITLQQGHFREAVNKLRTLEVRARAEFPIYSDKPWAIARWLAIAMDRQGRYFEAQEILNQMLQEIADVKMEPGYLEMANMADLLTGDALALVLAHLGNFDEAITLSTNSIKAIEAQLEIGGEHHANRDSWLRRLSRFKGNKACILALAGEYKQAELISKEASKTMEQYMGVNCVATLECWSLEARLLVALGKTDEAESKCQKTLDWMRLSLGKQHPSTLQTLAVLVSVYTSQARLTEARNTAKFLIEENKKVLELSHPQTIGAMAQLARIYVARGEFSQALPLQIRVTQLANGSLGKTHPSTLRYHSDLAMIYCSMSEWIKARSLSRRVFSEQCRIFIERLPESKEVIPSNGLMPESTESEHVMADKVLNDLLQQLQSHEDRLEKLDPCIFATMHCIGIIAREMKPENLNLALNFHAATTDFRKKKLGKDHPETLISQLQLAVTQRRRHDFWSARKNIEEVLRLRIENLGRDHPDSLSARHELCLVKIQMGELKEACEDQADILRLRNLLLGASHPDTIKSQQELPIMLEHLHLQALAIQAQLSEKTINDCSMLPQEEKQQVEEKVMKNLRDSAMWKAERLKLKVPYDQKRLTSDTVVSIKVLVLAYVHQRLFEKAVELQAVLNYHHELDLGHDDVATLKGMNQLASLYKMKAEAELSELARAEKAGNIGLQQAVLSSYCDTQSDLALLCSGTGDLETVYTIQAETLATLKKYSTTKDPLGTDLEARFMAGLADSMKVIEEAKGEVVFDE